MSGFFSTVQAVNMPAIATHHVRSPLPAAHLDAPIWPRRTGSARQAATGMRPRGVMLHTSGFGDGPRVGPGDREEGIELFFEDGQVFDMKAEIMIRGAEPAEVQFGDGVVVTERGARRLGSRELKLIALGA